MREHAKATAAVGCHDPANVDDLLLVIVDDRDLYIPLAGVDHAALALGTMATHTKIPRRLERPIPGRARPILGPNPVIDPSLNSADMVAINTTPSNASNEETAKRLAKPRVIVEGGLTRTWLYDKSKWPAGEWKNEPDYVAWREGLSGYQCAMLRHPEHSAWCAYVGVPAGHVLYGMDKDGRIEMKREDVILPGNGGTSMLEVMAEAVEDNPDGTMPVSLAFTVHNHVTYAGPLDFITTFIENEHFDDWFFGFAANGTHDKQLMQNWHIYETKGVPILLEMIRDKGTYRTEQFMREQCISLAEQLRRRA
jgi:hypothetical protein